MGNGRFTTDYMHARYYNATVGRFLSVDPVLDKDVALKNPQAWNRYAYVGNNPLTVIDPSGLGWQGLAGLAGIAGGSSSFGGQSSCNLDGFSTPCPLVESLVQNGLLSALVAFVTFYKGQTKAFETPPLQVADAMNNKLKTMPLRFSVSLSKLPPGEYNCQVTVLDPNGQKAAFWQAPVMLIP